ncbi:pyridoxine 5'-phosphate synthase [Chrysiogenes arsenatis]|uniref:pyridoxine 5'-phosphate synthase n=1 Tax=Chrysiogenes arsenatis TaxID=309797 RepID=UPI0003FE0669|nr:pyridoxine 5'-phosphate synthase [Chrysiogenes arsenatis]
MKLGVNIDHIATVRQARRGAEPSVVAAAFAAELGGADSITIHLREDRRHIQDSDLSLLRQTSILPLNLEMACTDEMIRIACEAKPEQVTLVPEKREELTTEGGLDVKANFHALQSAARTLREAGILVSFFVDPDKEQIQACNDAGAHAVEIHTGSYANAMNQQQREELRRIVWASEFTLEQGLYLHAGHGLNYQNVIAIAQIPGMQELNIGHSIISRALFCGLEQAVRHMKELMSRVMQS